MECVADEKFDIEQAAIRLLSVTEHTTLQLQRKLQKKGFDAEEVAEVLADLAGRKLLSDERFASQYLVMRSARGYGPLRIAQEMREKGVTTTGQQSCNRWCARSSVLPPPMIIRTVPSVRVFLNIVDSLLL
jgi:SOS response regulatory protein OraA/RecX